MIKKILTMDDLRIGMFVTILEGKKTTRTVKTPDGEQILTREIDKYKGSVLEIISIDLPYIVIKYYVKSMRKEDFKDSLDLREIKLKQLDFGYVQALFPDIQVSCDHFWDEVQDTSLEDADITIAEIFKGL